MMIFSELDFLLDTDPDIWKINTTNAYSLFICVVDMTYHSVTVVYSSKTTFIIIIHYDLILIDRLH